jgi:hypothetical protein
LITKAIIKSINATGTRCTVEIPLFKSASMTKPVEATALINIPPGIFNNLKVNDIVFIGFEENAMEKPIILGKLFTGASEGNIRGGGGVFNNLTVNSTANLPATTTFTFPQTPQNEYKDFTSLKSIADYIKWLESFTKANVTHLNSDFKCLKNWAQWQLKAENVEIDDGDLDLESDDLEKYEAFEYQEENGACALCGENCTKKNLRQYFEPPVDKTYPNI